jgi:hypothetical protein
MVIIPGDTVTIRIRLLLCDVLFSISVIVMQLYTDEDLKWDNPP